MAVIRSICLFFDDAVRLIGLSVLVFILLEEVRDLVKHVGDSIDRLLCSVVKRTDILDGDLSVLDDHEGDGDNRDTCAACTAKKLLITLGGEVGTAAGEAVGHLGDRDDRETGLGVDWLTDNGVDVDHVLDFGERIAEESNCVRSLFLLIFHEKHHLSITQLLSSLVK